MDRIASPRACMWCGRASTSGFDGKIVDALGRRIGVLEELMVFSTVLHALGVRWRGHL